MVEGILWNGHWDVPGFLRLPHLPQIVPVPYLVDTGASITTLPPIVMQLLNLTDPGAPPLRQSAGETLTASGPHFCLELDVRLGLRNPSGDPDFERDATVQIVPPDPNFTLEMQPMDVFLLGQDILLGFAIYCDPSRELFVLGTPEEIREPLHT